MVLAKSRCWGISLSIDLFFVSLVEEIRDWEILLVRRLDRDEIVDTVRLKRRNGGLSNTPADTRRDASRCFVLIHLQKKQNTEYTQLVPGIAGREITSDTYVSVQLCVVPCSGNGDVFTAAR